MSEEKRGGKKLRIVFIEVSGPGVGTVFFLKASSVLNHLWHAAGEKRKGKGKTNSRFCVLDKRRSGSGSVSAFNVRAGKKHVRTSLNRQE